MKVIVWRAVCCCLVLAAAGCGTSVYPRASGGDAVPEPQFPGTRPPVMQPRPTSDGAGSGLVVRRVCRARPIPTGWVATTYEMSDECPPRDEGETYTAAVIERLPDAAPGITFTMCADQTVPRGWSRSSVVATRECVGARVEEGRPTAVVIQRR